MKETKRVSTKLLVLLMALVLLIGCAAGGTIAWLMAKTAPVVNTFTVGDVDITLKEHVLDVSTGQWATPEALTDVGNQDIQVLPGREIQKDPTLTVLEGSEECYVRVFIKIFWSPTADSEFSQFEYYGWIDFNADWSLNRIFDGTTMHRGQYVGFDIYELRYIPGTVDASEEDQVIPVIYKMTFPTDLEKDQIDALNDCGLELIAQAVQAEGFASADEAFKAAGYPENWDPKAFESLYPIP